MQIDLLWFQECPNHEKARDLIRRAIERARTPVEWRAIEVGDNDQARALRFPGSPTIRVNGVDIEPGYEKPGYYALGCPVYATPGGFSGIPEWTWLIEAIDRHSD